jgi:hypothetical protein
MSDSQSRREMTRVPLQIETELHSEGHTLAVGKTTDITLRLGPQKHPIRIALEGAIVRMTDEGMAIEIISVPPDSFAHLHNLVIYNAQDANRIAQELHNRVSRRWQQAIDKEHEEKS